MARVTSSRVRLVAGPLSRPVGAASAAQSRREGAWLTLTDDQGREGHGEASPLPGYSPDELTDVVAALEASVDALVDDAPPSARFAWETARLDLDARAAGVSVARLVAGEGGVRAVPRNAQPGAACDAALVARSREAWARGVTVFKVKVGGAAWADERAALSRWRAAMPAGATLRLDANAQWSLDEARDALSDAAGLGVELVEQPCEDLTGLGALATPWAADESMRDARFVDALLGDDDELRRGCSAVVLKPAVLGGWSVTRELAARAAARGLGVVITHLMDGPIALAACCALACSLPVAPRACGLDAHPGLEAWPPWAVPHLTDDGWARDPGLPGLGVDAIA